MRFIFSYLKEYKYKVIVIMMIKFLGTVADLLLPFLLAYMIDDLLPDLDQSNYAVLYYVGALMLAIAISGWIFNVRANRSAEYVASYSVRNVRNDLFKKVEELSAAQVDKITTTSLISRMTTDTYNLYSFFGMIQRIGVRAPILLIGGVVISLFIDPLLALIMVLLLPFIGYISYRTTIKGQPLYRDIQYQVDVLIRTLRENITGVRVVRALSMTDYERQRFDNENNKTVKKELKATITMTKIRPLVDTIMNLGLVLVLVVGAYRIASGVTRVGDILALVTYFALITNAMMSLTRIFIQTSRASASAARIKEVVDLENNMYEGSLPIEVNKKEPHLSFENVSFSYHNDANHIENINFKLYQGQTLGIIGATGSGKTTLINLLLRFYDPQVGVIKLYGKDIKLYDIKLLRSHMGLVLQNDLIFSETIFENIQFSRSQINNEDVELASYIAQAGFINDIADGYHHKLAQRGMNISGGQKQRLLIARAIAGRPQLLVLDDASSALDYQTDMKLRQAINSHLKDTTKIIIAQRISSIKDSDLILLIEDGQIVASGTHDELMVSSKHYQVLAQHQLGKELS